MITAESAQRNGAVDATGDVFGLEPTRGNGLGLSPEGDGLLAVGAQVTQLGSPRAGKAEVGHRYRNRYVDADLAHIDIGLETARHPARVSKDRRAVAIGVGIDQVDCLVQRIDSYHTQHRTEDLLAVDTHFRRHVSE